MLANNSLVEELVASARAGQAAYLKATMMRDADLFAHAFFEGDDDVDYYYGYVANKFINSRPTERYVCNGKGEVIVARDLVEKNRPDLFTAFFVDRDFDVYLGENSGGFRTYVTDFYSIESYMALPSHIDILAKAKCLLDDQIAEHAQIIEDFPSRMTLFSQKIRTLCACMIWMRRNGIPSNFSRLKLEKFGIVQLDGTFEPVVDQIDVLKRLTNNLNLEVDEQAVASIEAEITTDNPLTWIRGKFVMEFVAKYFARRVEKIHVDKIKRSDGKKVKIHSCISGNNTTLCGEIGGTALMVPSLAAFLDGL